MTNINTSMNHYKDIVIAYGKKAAQAFNKSVQWYDHKVEALTEAHLPPTSAKMSAYVIKALPWGASFTIASLVLPSLLYAALLLGGATTLIVKPELMNKERRIKLLCAQGVMCANSSVINLVKTISGTHIGLRLTFATVDLAISALCFGLAKVKADETENIPQSA